MEPFLSFYQNLWKCKILYSSGIKATFSSSEGEGGLCWKVSAVFLQNDWFLMSSGSGNKEHHMIFLIMTIWSDVRPEDDVDVEEVENVSKEGKKGQRAMWKSWQNIQWQHGTGRGDDENRNREEDGREKKERGKEEKKERGKGQGWVKEQAVGQGSTSWFRWTWG